MIILICALKIRSANPRALSIFSCFTHNEILKAQSKSWFCNWSRKYYLWTIFSKIHRTSCGKKKYIALFWSPFSPFFWPPRAWLSAVEGKRHSHQQPGPVEGYFLSTSLLWRTLTFSKDVLKSSCHRFSTSPLRRYFDTPNITPFVGTQDSSVSFEQR